MKPRISPIILQKRGMNLEDFEVITDAICCAMNSTKFLRMCKMWLPQLEETVLYGFG